MYARGPECVGNNNSEVDDAALAGIEKIHIDRFEAFGFQRSTVVCGGYTSLPIKLKSNVQIERPVQTGLQGT